MFGLELNPLTLGFLFVILICQVYYFFMTLGKLRKAGKFFSRNGNYKIKNGAEYSEIDSQIVESGAPLYGLILELNNYIVKNHGTTDFNIIQNKTERKLSIMYEDAISRLSFPIFIGLMGTFVGVTIGLWTFRTSSIGGITDEAINNLISGVLISMITSFMGLLLTTALHHIAAKAKDRLDNEKDIFFEFIQIELMPYLGASIVEALDKLHNTIHSFETSFDYITDRFRSTFDNCANQFGLSFEKNVSVVAKAVQTMSSCLDKVNHNILLNEKLISTIKSDGLSKTLESFINASSSYEKVIYSINRFEELSQTIQQRTVELVELQTKYNESLELPLNVSTSLNRILDRVVNFENSINALGESIEKTDILGKTEIEALSSAMEAIRGKQQIALEALEHSDEELAKIFEMQSKSISTIGRKYENAISGFGEHLESELESLVQELHTRRSLILEELKKNFSADTIRHDFSQLGKLKQIEELLVSIKNNRTSNEMETVLKLTCQKVELIHQLMQNTIEDKKKMSGKSANKKKGFFGRIFR